MYLPVIGSRFNSRARSFEASCHSLDMLFGGGPAGVPIDTVRKENGKGLGEFGTLTKHSAREEQSTAGANANQGGQYELWHATGRVKRGTGAVRSKSDVISCR